MDKCPRLNFCNASFETFLSSVRIYCEKGVAATYLASLIFRNTHCLLKPGDADIMLWTSLKKGDRDALGKLFSIYYPLLIKYGSKLCTDPGLLEDCIQDLFADIWQSKAAPEVESVKAYLFKALKYKIFKKQHNRLFKSYSAELPDEMAFEISHETFLVEQQENRDRAGKLIDVLSQLPNRQREVIYLKIFQELSYEEVSHIMNINYQVCRNLMSQAIKTLRKFLVILTIAAIIPVI
jgi:RNA polymerase sigma factor (sigma-70 family)